METLEKYRTFFKGVFTALALAGVFTAGYKTRDSQIDVERSNLQTENAALRTLHKGCAEEKARYEEFMKQYSSMSRQYNLLMDLDAQRAELERTTKAAGEAARQARDILEKK